MFSELENRYFLHNAFCAYKTNYLKENPFNENLVGKEDRYWAEDVVKSGKKYFYEPSLICQHHFTNNGNVILESDNNEFASLIVSGTATGEITYNRYVNSVGTSEWDLIGSPVSGETASDIVAQSPRPHPDRRHP